MQKTLAIIKPDAVDRRLIGSIIGRIEAADLRIRAMRLVELSKTDAEEFYSVHKSKPFFDTLTDFMSSGPVIVMVLEAPEAINRWRRLMGATDPGLAERQTLRREFGTSIEKNVTHGSDAPETAVKEIGYFFDGF